MSRTPVPFIAPESPEWAPHDGEGTRYGLDDQPTTCPHCGARADVADVEDDGSQKATCLACGFRFVGDWEDWTEDVERGPRVLHLGMVATNPDALPAQPLDFGTAHPSKATAHANGGEAHALYFEIGFDSFRVWGNLEDPDESHEFDGTRHVLVAFPEGDAPADAMTEQEWGRHAHAHLSTYLATFGKTWRAADYVVWTDETWSENAHTVTCM